MKITNEMRDKVITLYQEGKTRAEIKTMVGISLPAIRAILDEKGYAPREGAYGKESASEADKKKLIDLYNKGLSAEQAALRLGFSKGWALRLILDRAEETEGRGKAISPELFIKTWQKSTTLSEVAEALGLDRRNVLARGYLYRHKGVPLKRLRTKASYNWEELAELAKLLLEEER
jgi:hypothetical protein